MRGTLQNISVKDSLLTSPCLVLLLRLTFCCDGVMLGCHAVTLGVTMLRDILKLSRKAWTFGNENVNEIQTII